MAQQSVCIPMRNLVFPTVTAIESKSSTTHKREIHHTESAHTHTTSHQRTNKQSKRMFPHQATIDLPALELFFVVKKLQQQYLF